MITTMRTRSICCALATLLLPLTAVAADAPTPTPTTTKPATPRGPKPTLADVAYGKHPKQVLDFYKAESAAPTPLVLFIHGGGWTGGSKASISSVADCAG